HVGRILLFDRMQAGLFTSSDLVAYIDLRGGVFADQYDGQTGTDALGSEGLHTLCDFFADALRQGGAVDDACALDGGYRRVLQGHACASGFASATFIRSATVVTSSFSMM